MKVGSDIDSDSEMNTKQSFFKFSTDLINMTTSRLQASLLVNCFDTVFASNFDGQHL